LWTVRAQLSAAGVTLVEYPDLGGLVREANRPRLGQ
jgi:hypothetical protein